MAEEEAQAQTPELINPALAAKQAEDLALQKAMEEIAATHKPVNLPAEEEIKAELAKLEEEQEGEEKPESEEAPIEETTEEATEEASTEETTEEPEEEKKEEEESEERTYTVKVNGVEKEVGEKELIRGFQKSEAADEKFQEAAKMREVFNSVAGLGPGKKDCCP
jgi:hypothetical protein